MTKSITHMDLSRRVLLGASAAASLAAIAPGQGQAKPLSAGRQAAAFYRVKVGDIEVTTVYDGQARRQLTDTYVQNASFADVQHAFDVALRSTTVTDTPFTFTVVNTSSKLAMIDTGTGGGYLPGVTSGAENLAAAGVTTADVDLVILSHFHGDHTFGLTRADGSLVYPNAEVLVPDIEYAFLKGDAALPVFKLAPLNVMAEGARKRLTAYGSRVRPYKDREEIIPGITAMATPGHSPGHMSFRISGGAQNMIVLGDVVTLPSIFVPNPTWAMVFDMDPAVAAATRLKILDEVATDRLLVAGTHFPFPAFGRIARRGTGYEYVPEQWSSTL